MFLKQIFKKRKGKNELDDVIKKDVVISNFDNKEFKKAIEGSKINILLGSGFTANIYKPLNEIEKLYSDYEKLEINNKSPQDVIIWEFFIDSILPMSEKNIESMQLQIDFFKKIREILSRRGNPVENKQVNIFTTNYDLLPELSIEYLNFDYNDGFKGKISPKFSTANYGNILIKNLVASNNKTEIESINLYKIHGSLSWKKGENTSVSFLFDYNQKIQHLFNKYNDDSTTSDYDLVKNMIKKGEKDNLMSFKSSKDGFYKEAQNVFNIVWPTKNKFNDSVINVNYYEILRIFSNELEKNQSLLIVFGFSFNDEHILEIVKRSLSNPTLLVYVFCYTKDVANEIYKKFKLCENFNNIKFIYQDNENFDLIKLNQLLEDIYL